MRPTNSNFPTKTLFRLDSTVFSQFEELSVFVALDDGRFICAGVIEICDEYGAGKSAVLVLLDSNFEVIAWERCRHPSLYEVNSICVYGQCAYGQRIFILLEGDGLSDPVVVEYTLDLKAARAVAIGNDLLQASIQQGLHTDVKVFDYVDVRAMAEEDEALIISGGFTDQRGVSCPFVMTLDLASWQITKLCQYENGKLITMFDEFVSDDKTITCFGNNLLQDTDQPVSYETAMTMVSKDLIADGTRTATTFLRLSDTVQYLSETDDGIETSKPFKILIDAVCYDSVNDRYIGLGALYHDNTFDQGIMLFDAYGVISHVFLLNNTDLISAASMSIDERQISIFVTDCADDCMKLIIADLALTNVRTIDIPTSLYVNNDVEYQDVSKISDRVYVMAGYTINNENSNRRKIQGCAVMTRLTIDAAPELDVK